MRIHVVLDDALVAALDERVGPRGRSAFVAEAVRRALDEQWRWEQVEAAVGTVAETGHEWDEDPAAWVRRQRRADDRRVG